jgi:hypothetical protein
MIVVEPMDKSLLSTGFMKRSLASRVVAFKGLPQLFDEHRIGSTVGIVPNSRTKLRRGDAIFTSGKPQIRALRGLHFGKTRRPITSNKLGILVGWIDFRCPKAIGNDKVLGFVVGRAGRGIRVVNDKFNHLRRVTDFVRCRFALMDGRNLRQVFLDTTFLG